MNGRPPSGAIELAAWIEEGARRLLRQAALGELGTDLSTAADETLIATGLAEGDAEITVSVEDWRSSPTVEPEPDVVPEPEAEEISIEAVEPEPSAELQLPVDELPEEEYMEQETRIMEPVPAEDEIRITATQLARGGLGRARATRSSGRPRRARHRAPRADRHPARPPPLPGARGRRLGGQRARLRPLRRNAG